MLVLGSEVLCLYRKDCILVFKGFPGGTEVKASACNMGDLGSIPGEGNGNPLQYSCLENPMDGGAWWATVHGSQRVRHDWVTSLSLSQWLKQKLYYRMLITMKKQKGISQMKGQDKIPEKPLNEVEIGNLPEKEFRIMIVKMIQDLGKRTKAKIEKM